MGTSLARRLHAQFISLYGLILNRYPPSNLFSLLAATLSFNCPSARRVKGHPISSFGMLILDFARTTHLARCIPNVEIDDFLWAQQLRGLKGEISDLSWISKSLHQHYIYEHPKFSTQLLREEELQPFPHFDHWKPGASTASRVASSAAAASFSPASSSP
jgi:hypothetical protein